MTVAQGVIKSMLDIVCFISKRTGGLVGSQEGVLWSLRL